MGGCSLLQGIFPTQGSHPGLPHCRQILYQLRPEDPQVSIQAGPVWVPSGRSQGRCSPRYTQSLYHCDWWKTTPKTTGSSRSRMRDRAQRPSASMTAAQAPGSQPQVSAAADGPATAGPAPGVPHPRNVCAGAARSGRCLCSQLPRPAPRRALLNSYLKV